MKTTATGGHGTGRKQYQEMQRQKIQASQLVNRLIKHVEGEVEMTATQVNAAKALLNKIVPDLKAIEVELEGRVHHSVSPEPMTEDEWENQYTVGSADGASEGAN